MALGAGNTRDGRDVKVADVFERAVEKVREELSDQPEIESALQNQRDEPVPLLSTPLCFQHGR